MNISIGIPIDIKIWSPNLMLLGSIGAGNDADAGEQ